MQNFSLNLTYFADQVRLKGLSKFECILEVLEVLTKYPHLNSNLDEVARIIHVSPHEFHQLFIDWSGVGPRVFFQFTNIGYSKSVLLKNKSRQQTLFDNSFHNNKLIGIPEIIITQMTELELKSSNMIISYSITECVFGPLFIASTSKGICYMVFYKSEDDEVSTLQKMFPKSVIRNEALKIHENALKVFNPLKYNDVQIHLHLKGTDFQIMVWKALLKINFGSLTTYQSISKSIGHPRSARATGTAIGRNPVTYLIPCHRVVQTSGEFGNYMWGSERKLAMIGWEAVKLYL